MAVLRQQLSCSWHRAVSQTLGRFVNCGPDSDTGKSVTFATFPANSWFGEGSILKREARKYNVIAVRDSRVALMPAVAFFRLLDTSIPFNRFILTQLNERLAQFIGAFEHDRLDEPEVPWKRQLT